MIARPLRIAILAHSTNPRGGVVHALELADALVALGHQCVVHAPDPRGKGFFRRQEVQDLIAVAHLEGGDQVARLHARAEDDVDDAESESDGIESVDANPIFTAHVVR